MLVGCQLAATALVWFGGGFCGLQNVWQVSLCDGFVYPSIFLVACPSHSCLQGRGGGGGNVSSVHKLGRRRLLLQPQLPTQACACVLGFGVHTYAWHLWVVSALLGGALSGNTTTPMCICHLLKQSTLWPCCAHLAGAMLGMSAVC